ncbi:TlpA family protein disulfide reductase [Rasiella rasia]|uniref:TlpA family protein disulfide reductase n=1 Tax=Rasiella rasia TaxID=2744027 RepID=A0A6G6GKM0_9FLAO|nr:TlpA disulfide reductase family protein [Rasiella rasia]QIE59125.1 TlpA family protein disulfide reductase [Rasiella rasia]
MKIIIAFISCLLLISCGEADSKKVETIDSTEIVAASIDVENASQKDFSDKLPIIDFKEFETTYLKATDTEMTYVLNFWATWCKPCVKELPYFEELNATYKDKNVSVVLVSLDFPENIEKQVLPFIEKHQLKSEVVLLDDPDANSWIPKVSKEWSGAIPATIIVKGDQYKFYEQSFTYSELETELKLIL